MARETRQPLVLDHEDMEVVNFFTEDLSATDAQQKTEALTNALKEDSEAYVAIYQTKANNMPESYCTRFPADKFDFGQIQELIANDYGAGDYRIRMYSKGRLRGNKLITIAPRINVDKNLPSFAGNDTAQILHTVLERMENNNQRMLQVLQQQNQPQDRMAMLQEMLLFKQLFSSDKPSGGLGQITEALELLKGLGVSVGNKSEDEEEGFGSMLKQLVPVAVQAMTAPQPQYRQQNPAPQMRPQPEPQTITEEENPIMFQAMQIKLGLKPLLKAAAKDADPAPYAAMLFDQLDEEIIQNAIANPDAIDSLINIEPEVGNYRVWFGLLAEHVKAMLGMESAVSELYDDAEPAINSSEAAANNLDDNEPTLLHSS